jgi:hypothetical protein
MKEAVLDEHGARFYKQTPGSLTFDERLGVARAGHVPVDVCTESYLRRRCVRATSMWGHIRHDFLPLPSRFASMMCSS